MTTYLTVDDLLRAGRSYLGRPVIVADYGLLESAVARPQATAYGQDAYPTVHEKAAALFESLIKNHALVDGNKRLAWTATCLFYALNDWTIPTVDAYDFILSVAAGEVIGVAEIAKYFIAIARRA